MGQVIAILMSYDNIYRDDNSDDNFMDNQYESSSTNNDEFNLSTASSDYEWHVYNNSKRDTKDHGITILN
jgi:hypothetical protein